jgi:hypothetical protein
MVEETAVGLLDYEARGIKGSHRSPLFTPETRGKGSPFEVR